MARNFLHARALRLFAIVASLVGSMALLPSPALAVPELSEVRRTDIAATALVGGTVVPKRQTQLFFSPLVLQAGGGGSRRVKEVRVEEGDRVAEGDLLAVLDGGDVEERLSEAWAQLSRAVAAQRQAEAAARAQAERLVQLSGQLARAREESRAGKEEVGTVQARCAALGQELVETTVAEIAALPPATPPVLDSLPGTRATLEQLIACQAALSSKAARAGAASATAEALQAQVDALSASRSQVGAASSQVAAARRQVELLERQQRALELRAPYAGIVASVKVKQGAPIPPTTPAVEIRSEELVARADLAEGDLLSVKPGAFATVTIRAAHLEVSASVGSIAQDPIRLLGGPITYPAYFELPLSQALRPGQTVRVKISTESRSGVLAVPTSAITENRGQYYVLVVSDGREEWRRVVPGVSDEKQTEIVEGLSEGEKVRTLAPRMA